MSMLKVRAWREAATIMLISKWHCGSGSSKKDVNKLLKAVAGQTASYLQNRNFDYRVLLLKRSSKSSFMPNALVFPGGAIDKADLTTEWWDVLERVGFSKDHLRKLGDINSARPLWTKNLPETKSKNGDMESIPLDIAFRLCAIRETFEESGVFLGRTKNVVTGDDPATPITNVFVPENEKPSDLAEWKNKVRKDAFKFLEMCREWNVCPDVFGLHEWSDWLTPSDFPHRFDTMFYSCFVEKIPDVSLDMKEIMDMQWYTPVEALTAHLEHNIWLPPPQFFELTRLIHIDKFDKLAKFTFDRREKGVETWFPVKMMAADNLVQLLPGDDLYPKEPELNGKDSVMRSSKTVEELNKCAIHTNRCILDKKLFVTKILCNVALPYGHLSPCRGA